MKLHILGSGTCIPNAKRGSSGYCVKLPESNILLDCGNGATWKLEKIGIDYLSIDHIFITHFHPDHTADLIPFLFATKYPEGEQRKAKLTVWGPEGIEELFEGFRAAYHEWIFPECLKIETIEEGIATFKDFTITAAKSAHTDTSLAYRIESEGKTLVYTGDTDYSEAIVEIANKTDLLLIECSAPDSLKTKGHLSPSDVARIAKESRARKVVVTHIYPVAEKNEVVKSIRSMVEVEVVSAEDLMEIEV